MHPEPILTFSALKKTMVVEVDDVICNPAGQEACDQDTGSYVTPTTSFFELGLGQAGSENLKEKREERDKRERMTVKERQRD